MIRFLETFFRHRILVAAPLLLAILIAVGYTMAQPRAYEAQASLWVDVTSPGNQSSTTPANQYIQPSDQQLAVVKELLSTRAFDIAVAHRGPLAKYLVEHPNDQKGLAAVPGIGRLFRSSITSVDDRVAIDLPSDVALAAAGPQVITVTVQGPTGVVAAGTAKALVDQFSDEILAAKTASAQTAAAYYKQQVAGAQATLLQDEGNFNQYLRGHPGVPASGLGDAAATQLSQAIDLAQRRYQSLLDQYEQAQLNLSDVANQSGFRVIDAPSAPTSAVGFTKRLVMAAVAGALVGAIVSLLMLLLITAADRSARRPNEVERTTGLEVASTIAEYSPTDSQRMAA